MKTAFQTLNGKRRVFRRVIRQNDSVHVVSDKIVEVVVVCDIFRAVRSFLPFQNFGAFVANGDDLRFIFRRDAVIYHTCASVCSQYSYFYHNKILLLFFISIRQKSKKVQEKTWLFMDKISFYNINSLRETYGQL